MNNKLKKVLIPLICIVLVVAVFFMGFMVRELTYSPNKRALLNVIDKYEKYYLYEDDNVIDVISDAIFDKYSKYLSKEDFEKVQREAMGEIEGIGVSFHSNSTIIKRVLVNTSSYKAGVKAGGEVVNVKIDGQEKSFDGLSELLDIVNSTSSDKSIELTVNYGSESISYNLKKTTYKKSYVTYMDGDGEYAFIDDGGLTFKKISSEKLNASSTSYIKYEQFSGKEDDVEGSVNQLKIALNAFKQKSNKNLILDLRDNGGGYMDILSEVAGLFVQKHSDKQVLSVAKDKHGNEENFYIKNNRYSDYGYEKIIVLANENTASASECLIGAMLDYDSLNKVTVVLDGHLSGGERIYKTYGKGIMQTTYKNLDGSAVKLTTAQIYWPSGVTIHGIGVTESTSNKVKNATNGEALLYALNLINQ